MTRTEAVVIGGGQAGLAMSRCLSDRGFAHVVLERGRIAERWRSERWDSLRLLTPNWLSRLPGYRYAGPDPDGYMSMPEVVDFLDRYARTIDAPVKTGTTVTGVDRVAGGFMVTTDRGTWKAPTVVVATGHCDVPLVPRVADLLPRDIAQVVPSHYRNPSDLPPGGVLVVGASATGIQLADEIHRSGRRVTLAVGRHIRLPRRYRGRDILWWLDRMGTLDQTTGTVHDAEVSRAQPSMQIVGRPDHQSLDLLVLAKLGVQVTGRLLGFGGTTARFDDDLMATTAASDIKLAELLGRIDAFATRTGLDGLVDDPAPFVPSWPAFTTSRTELDLRAAGIATVVWATGFARRYPWLHVPVLDARGEIRHRGGVTDVPGLYVLGLHFMRRRKSAFIDGVGDDARVLAGHIASSRWSARDAVA